MKERDPESKFPLPRGLEVGDRVRERVTKWKGTVLGGGRLTARHVRVRFDSHYPAYNPEEVSVDRLTVLERRPPCDSPDL